ncbi:MAG: ATP-binding cassette domain-containing protein [Fimbriimonadales bacterium]|nr:ATP-binding cassette domain-containing protein [Fimbriimonadales bacterium]
MFDRVEVKYSETVALDGVSFEVQKGEFVFFVGRTGAGKSTILKVISREVQHTGGRALLDGRELGEVRPREVPHLRRQMGIVPQDFALLPSKRVWENVAYAMRAIGASSREVRRKVPEILERVSIGHRADAFPHQLSGGEQQRVAIARALINNPLLLLADEPTGNLDPEHSIEIMELLAQLNVRGTTVLVASHDMLVVERMDKRVIRLESGRIVEAEEEAGLA